MKEISYFAAFDLGSEIPVIVEYKKEYQEIEGMTRFKAIDSEFNFYSFGEETLPIETGSSVEELKAKIPEYFV